VPIKDTESARAMSAGGQKELIYARLSKYLSGDRKQKSGSKSSVLKGEKNRTTSWSVHHLHEEKYDVMYRELGL